ncbi:MAG: sulfatase-like hydrolase/transferase [Nitrospiraceae bacterium]
MFDAPRQDGLLENTVVLILGDHGRHERVGRGGAEQFVGHHTIPLFPWADLSLREELGYRPRVVTTTGSQVDIALTVLGLAVGWLRSRPAFVGET